MLQGFVGSPVIRLLRRSPAARSAAYLGSMVGVLALAMRAARGSDATTPYYYQHLAFPGVLALTGLFARLRPEDWATFRRMPQPIDLMQAAGGAALGGAASASLLAAAATQGWVSAPAWGWEQPQIAPATVAASIAFTAAHTVVSVYNEEMIFRGYGLDTLRDTFGSAGALIVSAALFALYHGPGWRRFLGLCTAGLFYGLLRFRTGSLWLGAGFHFMWNLVQEGVFGPPDQALSLRPLLVHGPEEWIGRPGYPQPGWLHIIWILGLTAAAGASLWRATQAKPSLSAAGDRSAPLGD